MPKTGAAASLMHFTVKKKKQLTSPFVSGYCDFWAPGSSRQVDVKEEEKNP
jgi:hypothetical protein